MGVAASAVGLVAIFGGPVPAFVLALALLGMPLFAVMGGASELAWLRHHETNYQHLRFIAGRILTSEFADSPILVTIPLFTFVGYVLARARTAERLVRFSSALLGWLPGGLAIVCVVTSAVFTLLTGGSGVTIIAIGGLLLPALRKEGYSDKFSLGVLTSGGSLGLLLPFSLPLLVYTLVAGVSTEVASLAVLAPGALVLGMYSGYSIYIGIKEKVPRKSFDARELVASFFGLFWELLIPVILGVSLVVLQFNIDECAGIIAAYTVIIEVFVYKDVSFKKDIKAIVKESMSMAGAVIVILTMANALVEFIVFEHVPSAILNFMVRLGLDQKWQFLLAMNVFLLILGMLMEGFSAILIAVPLLIPFAAKFHLGPFHLGMIFLLNLELAYCMPPLGLNLFIASFRFRKPAVALYRPMVPFLALLGVALFVITYVPRLSSVLVESKIREERAKADKNGDVPRDAWKLECVQEDRLNPKPCTAADEAKFPDGRPAAKPATDDKKIVESPLGSEDDELLKQMGAKGAPSAAPSDDSDDELLKQMGAKSDAGPAPKQAPESDDDLMKEMLGPKNR